MNEQLVPATSNRSQKTSLSSVPIAFMTDLTRCSTPIKARKELREVRTVMQSLDSGLPSIGLIQKVKGETFALAYLKMWVIDLQDKLNIRNKMNEHMIDAFAEAFLDEFRHLTISDIKIVFTAYIS